LHRHPSMSLWRPLPDEEECGVSGVPWHDATEVVVLRRRTKKMHLHDFACCRNSTCHEVPLVTNEGSSGTHLAPTCHPNTTSGTGPTPPAARRRSQTHGTPIGTGATPGGQNRPKTILP
jgi:hypothetical protein